MVDSRLVRAALLSLLALAACGPTQSLDSAFTRRDAILGGGLDTTTGTVFVLDIRFDNATTALCSSTLVSPRVLLTAAHCVDPALKGATAVTTSRATNKADCTTLSPSDMTTVTVITRHPLWNPSDLNSPHDMAMLLLASAPDAGMLPAPLVRTLPANFSGQPVRLVGYGVTAAGAGDSAIRRQVTQPVTTVAADTFNFGVAGSSGICSGDSGGPAFFSVGGVDHIAGVHSRTNSAACGTGTDIRVDTHLAFIDGFIAANDPPSCLGDGRCVAGCTPADPDCPLDCTMNSICVQGCAPQDPDCACLADAMCEMSCPGGRTDPDCACLANSVCEAGCAVVDPDCVCISDGMCETACPGSVVDPDCRCRADSTCETSCPTGVTDPDCLCVLDATCETACPTGVTDPDCRCRADSTCEGNCPSGGTDPDCTCGADAVCVATCPSTQLDPDCAQCGAEGTCSAASCPSRDPDCLNDGTICTSDSECDGKQCLTDPRGFLFCSRACTGSAECQLDMVCTAGLCQAPSAPDPDPVKGGCAVVPGAEALALLGLARALRRRRAA